MINEKVSYWCVCDCCGRKQFDDFPSEDTAMSVALDDGWEYSEDSHGDWKIYCPNCHPIYACHHCGLKSDCMEPGW